jgi:hypothetical protein
MIHRALLCVEYLSLYSQEACHSKCERADRGAKDDQSLKKAYVESKWTKEAARVLVIRLCSDPVSESLGSCYETVTDSSLFTNSVMDMPQSRLLRIAGKVDKRVQQILAISDRSSDGEN